LRSCQQWRRRIHRYSDGGGVELTIELGWTDAAHKVGSRGISSQVILLSDHLNVSKFGLTWEDRDIQSGCAKMLDVGPDGKTLPSDANIQRINKCRSRGAIANATRTHHAVILPFATGARKCTETGLTNGLYRICAALLQQSPDTLRMEYEENTEHDGKLSASRVRFDITLLRGRGPLSGLTENCTAKTIAAFTFNPSEPSKLMPFDHATIERCTVVSHGSSERKP
jgi:hypothetical protein